MRGLTPHRARIVFGYATTSTGPGYVGRSRWVDDLWRHPPLDRNAEFVDALRAFVETRPDVRFVVPVGDTEIRTFDRLRSALPQQVHYLLVDSAVLRICRQKDALLSIARELGVPTADYRCATTAKALLDAADAVGYPCVVKAQTEASRAFGRKALIVMTRGDLERAIESQPDVGASLVQSFVSGDRHGLYFFAEAGVVRAVAQFRVIRTDRRDGTGYAVEGITVPTDRQWRDHLERLALRIGYDGPGCLQFIDDRGSRSTLLELNARLGATHAAVDKAGLRLVRWWMERLQCGNASIPADFECRPGLRYGWFYGDAAGWLSAMGDADVSMRDRIRWSAALLRTLTAPNHIVWDWRDPSPAFHLYGHLLSRR